MNSDRYAAEKVEVYPIGDWKKLKLLMWKNWILQRNQKLQLFLAVFAPALFLMLVVGLRVLVAPHVMPKLIYEPVSISNLQLFMKSFMKGNQILHQNGTLNIPKLVLCYTPDDDVYATIIRRTVQNLRLMAYRPYDSRHSMEEDMVEHNFFAGVQFEDRNNLKLNEKGYPLKLNYTIRFPSELRTMRGPIIDTWRTDTKFTRFNTRGARNWNESDGGVPAGYIMEGFLPVQHILTMSWMTLASGKELMDMPQIWLRRFPYPAGVSDPLLMGLRRLLPFIIMLSFIYPSTVVARAVTNEKELQLKEIMKLIGVNNWIHWVAWFVKSYLLLMAVLAVTLIVLFTRFKADCAVFNYSQVLPVFMFFHCYIFSGICFCFMIAVLFSRASTASAVVAITWFLTFTPYTIANNYYDSIGLPTALLLCFLLCNTSLGFGLHIILDWEATGDGLTTHTMFQPLTQDHPLTIYLVMLMLTLSGVMYLTICLYVEQVNPGEFGIPRKWNFCLSRKFWFKKPEGPRRRSGSIQRILDRDKSRRGLQAIGVRLINLEKCFGHHTAVRGLNLKMYRDEITVLLGHNGAGKTTTINMLTGITPPTKGTAIINGYDIRTQLAEARQSIGICPQNNILFSHMSVRDHIVFFSKLKGVHGSDAIQREVKKYVEILGLEKKSKTASRNLSGGMKRKLALCCALCGDAQIVMCDEPSSGIDAAGRRSLWELLQAEKKGRTILLTTHYMDEADVLGDRIAILSEGQLQCCGTSFLLKKRYGPGYQLVCIMQKGCDVNAVTHLINRHLPQIKIERMLGSELTYRLPNRYSRKFPPLLKDLENNSAELKLDGYGLSVASLEDVFMQVSPSGRLAAGEATTESIPESPSSVTKSDGFSGLIFDLRTKDSNSCSRCCSLWQGLSIKKIFITIRFYWIVLVIILLPMLIISLAILNSRGGQIYYELPPLHLSLNGYKSGYVILEDKAKPPMDKVVQAYVDHVAGCGSQYELLRTGDKDFDNYILDRDKSEHFQVYYETLAGATIANDNLTVWLNNNHLHTAPVTLNVLHNALATDLLGNEAYVGVTNEPLPYSRHTMSQRLNKGHILGTEVAVHFSLTMGPITAFYAIPIIRERESRAKLIQFLSGVDVFAYWLTHFVWDFLTFVVSALSTILTLAAHQESAFKEFNYLCYNFAVILIFGCAALPLSYFISGFCSDSASGFIRIGIMNILTGASFFMLRVTLSVPEFELEDTGNRLAWIFRIFPHFSLASAIHHLHIGYSIRRGCKVSVAKTLFQKSLCSKLPICCNIPGYFDWKSPGVLPEIVYMAGVSVFLLALLVIKDAKLHYFINDQMRRGVQYASKKAKRKVVPETYFENTDVDHERRFVKKVKSDERMNIPLLVDNISKKFGKKYVVKNITFHVDKAECFGLLGINGAGKTTTFKMLSGDETITSGEAYIEGISLSRHWYKVYGRIGYCPQFDALFTDLTGRQTLRIFCMLRGVQRRYISTISWALAIAFGFQQHMNKLVKYYSGGNKRKLSVAIAVIGSPSVVFLDEPTSGMDPGARRHLWKMISMIRSAGKSIVLTSHSMDECETLCTRLAIMVDGEFKCIGSVQGLKNNYSKGLILKIKVKQRKKALQRVIESSSSEDIMMDSISNDDRSIYTPVDGSIDTQSQSRYRGKLQLIKDTDLESRIQNVIIFIRNAIPDADFREEYNGLLTYYIPQVKILPEIFQLIENNMKKLNIEDYLIMQTRLEEIFLEFAMNQRAEDAIVKR